VVEHPDLLIAICQSDNRLVRQDENIMDGQKTRLFDLDQPCDKLTHVSREV